MLNRTTGNYADLDYSGKHEFKDDHAGSFSVFRNDHSYITGMQVGWYWIGEWSDADLMGPFATSADAYHDAQGY